MGRRKVVIAALAVLLALPAHATPRIRLSRIDGAEPAIWLANLHGPRVVLFWRSDCAPCMIELRNYAAFRQATGGALALVALEPPSVAARTLSRWRVPTDHAYFTRRDPMLALEAVSNGGRRLPLAIALDRRGRICARHVGLLGTIRARQWIRRCSR